MGSDNGFGGNGAHPPLAGPLGFANHLLDALNDAKDPLAAKLQGDIALHARDNGIIYSIEAGPESAMPYAFYATLLGSGAGAGMLSQSLNYGRGFFEGEKFFKSNGKIYIPHPDDNISRMREGALRLGYQFDYSNEKLAYLSGVLFGMNGWMGNWPKVEGQDASCVYLRPLVYFMFNTKIRLGGPHYNLLALIPEPMGSYFDDKTRELGVNVFLYDSPRNPYFAADDEWSMKNNSNYETACYLRNLTENLPATAETIKFTEGMLKEGSSDTVGIITPDGKLVFPPLSTGRLNGITGRFVEEMGKTAGYTVEMREIPMGEFLSAKGVILLGNAVNFLGVGKAQVPVEYLEKYAPAASGGLPAKSRKTYKISGKGTEVAEFAFDTMSSPIFHKVKAAFDAHLPEYSLCISDIFVPDAGEKLEILGKRLREAVPDNSWKVLRMDMPALLADGAKLTLGKRLWPTPHTVQPSTAWSNGLRAKQPQLVKV